MSAERSPGKPLSDRLRAQLRALQPAKGDPDLGPLLGTIARLASTHDAAHDKRPGRRAAEAARPTSPPAAPELRTLARASDVEDRLTDVSSAGGVLRRLRAAFFADPTASAQAHGALSLTDALALLGTPSPDEAVCTAAYRTLDLAQTPADRLASRVIAGALAALQRARVEPVRPRIARALALISVLRSSIDEAAVPEVSRDLRRLYDFCLELVWTALMDLEPQPLAEAALLLATLRDASA